MFDNRWALSGLIVFTLILSAVGYGDRRLGQGRRRKILRQPEGTFLYLAPLDPRRLSAINQVE